MLYEVITGEFDGQTYEDVWYLYDATCNGTLSVSTCGTADYDTDLVLYAADADGSGRPKAQFLDGFDVAGVRVVRTQVHEGNQQTCGAQCEHAERLRPLGHESGRVGSHVV